MMNYVIPKTTDMSFEQALEKVTAELQKEGFGIITSIDMKETLKKRLGVDFKKYTILGACNPGFAHKSLLADESIGAFLPCNVLVYEQGNKTIVSAFDPQAIGASIQRPEIQQLAQEVRSRLQRVIEAL